ncbi:hypothetical protein CRUP_030188, partial [Coryphaenoides rupestris]
AEVGGYRDASQVLKTTRPTTNMSPDGKKKKKEKSELRMRIKGKDKSHKQDAKGGAEHDLQKKGGKGGRRSGLGSLFDKRSTPKMSKLKEVHSPESEVIVKTTQDGGVEGLIVGGGGKDGIFIKQVVPESPAYKNLHVNEGDQILSATVYFDNVTYEDALQIMEHVQAYKVKLCLKRKPEVPEEYPDDHPETIQEEEVISPEMRGQRKTKRHSDARISWPKFPSLGKGKKKTHFRRSHSTSEAEDQTKLELSPTTNISLDESPPVYITHQFKIPEGCAVEQGVADIPEPESAQHRMEFISVDSTLKTADLTVALVGHDSPTTNMSPDGKKKKKEKSELRMRIKGKDKSHKQDAKVKSSPKRLQTLGASIEIPDPTTNKNLDTTINVASHLQMGWPQIAINTDNKGFEVISASVPTQEEKGLPKVELSFDMPDVGILKKSPKRGKEKPKKEVEKSITGV